jgi:hypothetical protein
MACCYSAPARTRHPIVASQSRFDSTAFDWLASIWPEEIMRLIYVLLLLTIGLVTGCETKVLDARGPNDVCEIHHQTMESTEVEMPKHAPPLSREYQEARLKLFLHAVPRQLPYQAHTKYVVFICDYCVLAEQQWLQAHPQDQH